MTGGDNYGAYTTCPPWAIPPNQYIMGVRGVGDDPNMTAQQINSLELTPQQYAAGYAALSNRAGWPTPDAYGASYATAVAEGDIADRRGLAQTAINWAPVLIAGVIIWFLITRSK